MMGQNKNFINNPLQYLRGTALLIPQHILPAPNAAGIATFDLRPIGPGRAQLEVWAPHPKSTSPGKQRLITAYWLEYQPGQTRARMLGAGADYMFTPQLDGCFIGIGAGAANAAVAHVAGDIPGNHIPANLVAAAVAGVGGALARRFESTTADCTAVTFVGVRSPVGWTFYAQGNNGNVGHLHHPAGLQIENVYATAAAAAAEGFPGQGNQTVVTL